jgi:adenylosuccinate lyase
MLAKTHGQPASPTVLGKEIMVFVERISNQITLFSHIPFAAKFGGATGNFNAHQIAYPEKDWLTFANNFVENNLGLSRSLFTTQIEHYDNLAALFDCLKRINTILLDLDRDMWTYISMDYFKQQIKAGEVGSSAMPHKVNPIRFENAEANLELANAILDSLAQTLVTSRLQRDLTDSSAQRNIGVGFGHSLLAIDNLTRGLDELAINESVLLADLLDNWEVLGEAIQTAIRADVARGLSKISDPYALLKELTRGKRISEADLLAFIDGLDIPSETKARLKALKPNTYVGLASELTEYLK